MTDFQNAERASTELIVEGLSVLGNGGARLSDVSVRLKAGELVALLGPNGAGKTTLLRAALGLIPSDAGSALLDGRAIVDLTPIERARHISYLPQTRALAWPNRVVDIVSLGRFAYGAAMGELAVEDRDAVNRALSACDIAHLRDRPADTLSGGELARVHCARAFAAEAALLLADEPVAAQDPRHQYRVLELFSEFVYRGGGAMIVLHDVALAAKFADRLVWMKAGEIVADGPPQETLTSDRMADVFRVRSRILRDATGLTVLIDGPV